MAVLDVVDGVAQHPFRLRFSEHRRPHGPVGVGGDHQEGAGQVAPPETPGDVGALAPADEVAEPVGDLGGDDGDVGLGLEQRPRLALRLGAAAGDDAPPAGELEGDRVAERHACTVGPSRESAVFVSLPFCEQLLAAPDGWRRR